MIKIPILSLKPNSTRWALTALVLLVVLVELPGLVRDLPYANDFDEPTWVITAVRMAATGDINPRWFGHPGSTVTYPLAVLYHTWFAFTQKGSLLQLNPGMQTQFDSGHAWEYYLLGRLLAVTYHILSLPLVYFLGTRTFGRRTALAGALLYIFFPNTVFYARMVRSDSAATFFGVLCLWRCSVIPGQPSLRNQLYAGAALGLAIASRYFMATLTFVYAGVSILHFIKAPGGPPRWKRIKAAIAGGVMVILAFALSTPYFFLDFNTVLQNFVIESRPAHLGYDGLSPAGNLWWYLTTGLPLTMTWAPALFALIGIGFTVFNRKVFPKILAGFSFVFLVTISLPALHWPRWTLQVLPVLALFAANAVDLITARMSSMGWYSMRFQRAVFISGTLVIMLLPLYRTLMLDIKWSHFSTRVDAAEWIREYIPPGTLVAMEIIQIAVDAPGSQINEIGFLAEMNLSPEELAAQGYDYAIVNEDRYGRYYAEPERYPEEVEFYETLFAEARLVQEFPNSATKAGPTLRVYALEK